MQKNKTYFVNILVQIKVKEYYIFRKDYFFQKNLKNGGHRLIGSSGAESVWDGWAFLNHVSHNRMNDIHETILQGGKTPPSMTTSIGEVKKKYAKI